MNRANSTILALALMVALCGAASAAELHVGTEQTYSTIQDAVDNATSGILSLCMPVLTRRT